MIKIQNVVFFQSKNLIQISRGLKQVFLSFTQGGGIVVKLEGYDRYFFCPDTLQVFSRKSKKKFEPLKAEMDGVKVFYRLSMNGCQRRVYVWEILRDNRKGIETFCETRSKKPALNLVSANT